MLLLILIVGVIQILYGILASTLIYEVLYFNLEIYGVRILNELIKLSEVVILFAACKIII